MRTLLYLLMGMLALGAVGPFASSTRADSSGSGGQPIFHIQQMDKDVPVERLAGPGIQIHKYGERPGHWALPSVVDREQAFYHAGLRPDITSWDQLDRDMLYLRARDTSLADLTTQYPKLAKYKLKSLHKLIAPKITKYSRNTASQRGSAR